LDINQKQGGKMEDIRFEVIKKISQFGFRNRNLRDISKLDSNSPPSIFIGSKLKYPNVNIGILSPLEREENVWVYDDAKYWANNNFQIADVLKLRNNLLNSKVQSNVYDARANKNFIQMAQEIATAYKPVDLEIELKNKLNVNRSKDRVLAPHGLRAELKKAKIIGNTKVHQQVDKVINDDIKAVEGIESLYKFGFDEYTLSKIFSVGVLGLNKNKKLVPTRWSITATDDTLGKLLLKKVRDYPLIENHELFFGEFLGNQYLIMLFPRIWSYELFELYLPKSSWNPSSEIKASTDYEDYHGRKEYASSTAGGYYASRFPIIEYLNSIKRQASVLVIRLETPTYWAGLGVWVVRESVRKALTHKMTFSDEEELKNSTKKIGKIRYNFDISQILDKSRLLKEKREQKSLNDFV
jgi:DNA repair protein NreA